MRQIAKDFDISEACLHRWLKIADRNQVWLTDITEHRTDEGRLYLCAIKDVYSNSDCGLLHHGQPMPSPGERKLAETHPKTAYRRALCSVIANYRVMYSRISILSPPPMPWNGPAPLSLQR